MVILNVVQLVGWQLVGETEVLGGNLSQGYFIHDKSHMAWDRNLTANRTDVPLL
jgi:hypothetical protein